MNNNLNFMSFTRQRPQAFARLRGSEDYPGIYGTAYFYQTAMGVIVSAQLENLPKSDDACRQPIFAFHIHSGEDCGGNEKDPFADAMSHYNPNDCLHPYHAGDLPPLFGCDGYAFSVVLTNRFTVKEIIGKTLIVHSSPDDFTSQPSGNSGTKIACGSIGTWM